MKAGDIKKRALGTICASLAKDLGEFSVDVRQVVVETAESEAKRLLEEDRPKPPDNVRALIVWRDSLALDWSGFELVDHVTFRLKELTPEERPEYLPSEHAEALTAFQAYSDDEQRNFVRTVIEDLYGLIDDDADPYGYPE
jgi:hypothetical protein